MNEATTKTLTTREKTTMASHPECVAEVVRAWHGGVRATIFVNGFETTVEVCKDIDDDDEEVSTVEVTWASLSDKSVKKCEVYAKALLFALALAKLFETETTSNSN